MKSTKYFDEITTQKAEKYVWGRKTKIYLLACAPYVSTKKFLRPSLLKSVENS